MFRGKLAILDVRCYQFDGLGYALVVIFYARRNRYFFLGCTTNKIFKDNLRKPAAFLKGFNSLNVSSIGHGNFAGEYKGRKIFIKLKRGYNSRRPLCS